MDKEARRNKLNPEDRIIDLLERTAVINLYLSTDLGQNEIASKLGMDIHRVNPILKGIKKGKTKNGK